MDPKRLSLRIAGADTVLGSELCASCPYSAAGCCVAPPRYDWSDLARVVTHGGGEWLVAQLAAGRLVPVEHGLAIRREKRRVTADRGAPRIAKCTFHDGGRGCTIDETQRPGTCNFYLCDRSLEAAEDPPTAARATEVHDALVNDFVGWDAVLDARVKSEWPATERYSSAFFTWLGDNFVALRDSRGGPGSAG